MVLPMQEVRQKVDAQAVGIATIFANDAETYEIDLRYMVHSMREFYKLTHLSGLLLDATQHSENNFFSQTIQPVYDQCKLDSGMYRLPESKNYSTDRLR